MVLATDLLSITDSARDFLVKAGHVYFVLQNADYDSTQKRWILKFDVGITKPFQKIVTLDESGKVLSFE